MSVRPLEPHFVLDQPFGCFLFNRCSADLAVELQASLTGFGAPNARFLSVVRSIASKPGLAVLREASVQEKQGWANPLCQQAACHARQDGLPALPSPRDMLIGPD